LVEATGAEPESCCGSAAAACALASDAAVVTCPAAAIAERSWDDGVAALVADAPFEPSAFTAAAGVVEPSGLPTVAGCCGAALLLFAVGVSEDGSDVAATVPEAEPFAGAAT
jgi:hypothetical protein